MTTEPSHFDDIAARISEAQKVPPPGFGFGAFANADGARIRYGHAPVKGRAPAGVAVMVTGFNESIEKYHETMRDLQARGLEVWIMDWRGQGGSERYHADQPQRPWSAGYDRDVRDLNQFVREVIHPEARYPGLPKVLFGHSMGGHMSVRYLHDHPETFDAAVLTAPMLEVRTKPLPRWAARGISALMTSLGLGHRYIPGGDDWRDTPERKTMKELIASDPVRAQLQNLFYRDRPELRLGDPTFRWLHEALASTAEINQPAYLKAIRTPLQLHSARNENLVEPSAHDRAARLIPNAELVSYPQARHELWMETDAERNRLLSGIDGFLARHIPGYGLAAGAEPAPKVAGTPAFHDRVGGK